jgi:hypothetical protein
MTREKVELSNEPLVFSAVFLSSWRISFHIYFSLGVGFFIT